MCGLWKPSLALADPYRPCVTIPAFRHLLSVIWVPRAALLLFLKSEVHASGHAMAALPWESAAKLI